ncbi:Protein SRG1 [Linum perenne]
MEAPILQEREIVQELGKEAPQKFFQKDIKPGIAEGTLPLVDLPIVDISLLTSPNPSIALSEIQKLGSALSTYSTCLAINHGMERTFLDSIRDTAAEFFHLPLEEKLKHVRKPDHWEGYGFDQYPKEYESHEWSDRLMILLSPEHERKIEFWPNNPTNFKGIMEKCCTETMKMLETVLKSMAKSLRLEDEECFIKELGEPQVIARFNYYPPCLTPDQVLGTNEHTDPTMLAFLLLDKEVEGTHILVDGQWFRIPVKPNDSFLIMMGDVGEVIISNGAFEASMHRGALNREKTRQTMGLFFTPQKDKTVGPVEELLSEAKPARYLRVTNYASEHVYDANHRKLINSKMIMI